MAKRSGKRSRWTVAGRPPKRPRTTTATQCAERLNVSRRATSRQRGRGLRREGSFLKAAGTGLREPFALRDIEAVRLESGAPAYRFSGPAAAWVAEHGLRAHLSLSHEGGMALAFCVLET